jgi:Methyltransferase domain
VNRSWLDKAFRQEGRHGDRFGVLGRQPLATMARMSLRQQTARALRGVAWRVERPPVSLRRQTAPPPQAPGALVPADSAPGSRTASWFFEQFPRFYLTSSTAPTTARLNLRYEAIFGENRDIFAGASVLDLASHDGRWSLVALATGARSVVGIEARPDLVKAATENLAEYGYGADRARFITGDVHEVLNTQDFEADVVLCLGFLYHTLRYNELLGGIRRTDARYLIIDTFSPHMMGPVPNVNLTTEDADEQGKAAADAYTHGASVLVGRPNLAAIRTMLGAYGYRVERLSDWAGLLRDNPGTEDCGDYANEKRITVRCIDATAAPAPRAPGQ